MTAPKLVEHCDAAGVSPWAALEQVDAGTLDLQVKNVLARFRELKHKLTAVEGLVGPGLVDALFPDGQQWARPLREASLLKIQDNTPAEKLFDVLRTAVTQPEMPESGDFVRVMSLHKSKGLTSRAVIVAGCIEGLIPNLLREGTPAERLAHFQEQRRIFYVAVTRAKEVLVLSSVTNLPRKLAFKLGASVKGLGGMTIASRFLDELGPNTPPAKLGSQWQSDGYT